MGLVLTRRLGERIVIGDDITVTVVLIDENKVRLDIEAPRDVAIWREEIRPAGPADRGPLLKPHLPEDDPDAD